MKVPYRDSGGTIMDTLTLLLDAAGARSARVAIALLHDAKLDARPTLERLADALVFDAQHVERDEDAVIITDRASSARAKRDARARQTLRSALTDDLLALSPARRCALIDDLAGGRGKQAAKVIRDDAAAVSAVLRDDLAAEAACSGQHAPAIPD
jgi:hypothetical protein